MRPTFMLKSKFVGPQNIRVYVNKESRPITETHIKAQCERVLEEDVITIIYELLNFILAIVLVLLFYKICFLCIFRNKLK